MQRRHFNSLLIAAGGTAAAGCATTGADATAQAKCAAAPSAGGITERDFRDYIAAFNRSDFAGFSRYYADDVEFEGRGRHFHSREEVLHFYREVKRRMRETITVHEVIVGEQGLAAEIETELFALEDWPELVTGAIKKGETIRTQSFAWYEIRNGKFAHIRTARYRKLSSGEITPTRAASSAIAKCKPTVGMTAERFAEYIDAFNRDDYSKFGDFYDEDVVLVIAGKTELRGRQTIFDFYKGVKAQTQRTLQVNKIITAPDQLAVELQSEFLALQDLPNFTAGPMKKGGRIFINTFVFYDLRDGKFARIRSAEFNKIDRQKDG